VVGFSLGITQRADDVPQRQKPRVDVNGLCHEQQQNVQASKWVKYASFSVGYAILILTLHQEADDAIIAMEQKRAALIFQLWFL
jgi:hypothetical protein